jgi:hypothetical protein
MLVRALRSEKFQYSIFTFTKVILTSLGFKGRLLITLMFVDVTRVVVKCCGRLLRDVAVFVGRLLCRVLLLVSYMHLAEFVHVHAFCITVHRVVFATMCSVCGRCLMSLRDICGRL